MREKKRRAAWNDIETTKTERWTGRKPAGEWKRKLPKGTQTRKKRNERKKVNSTGTDGDRRNAEQLEPRPGKLKRETERGR